jgi:nucleotide-binding universal stress UspA family protein
VKTRGHHFRVVREALARWGLVPSDVARSEIEAKLGIQVAKVEIESNGLTGGAHGFVDKSNGQIRLERILFPVAHRPSPIHSARFLTELLAPIGVSSAAFHFMHVGDSAPKIVGVPDQSVEVADGPIEETILRVAQDYHADMIAMPTAGHHGFLDALRGSTTEFVLRRAPCPVLAIPAPIIARNEDGLAK